MLVHIFSILRAANLSHCFTQKPSTIGAKDNKEVDLQKNYIIPRTSSNENLKIQTLSKDYLWNRFRERVQNSYKRKTSLLVKAANKLDECEGIFQRSSKANTLRKKGLIWGSLCPKTNGSLLSPLNIAQSSPIYLLHLWWV